MSETIELRERYPQSRREDITDAFMRGADVGRNSAMAENARLNADLYQCTGENDELRQLVRDMHDALQAFCEAQGPIGEDCPLWVEREDECDLRAIEARMAQLGIEVDW